jgi:outer membrane protein OmpA-like peptidoglycan-associated protein
MAMSRTTARDGRERHPRLPLIPLVDGLLLVFALGAAKLTAQQHQLITLDTAIEQEVSTQGERWTERALALCVPAPEAPHPPRSRSVLDLLRSLGEMDTYRERVWALHEDCVDEQVEVIPEDLLRFSFNRWNAFDMSNAQVDKAKARIREIVHGKPDRRRIFVRGHTDWKGTEEYNYRLSADRAWYVGKVILDHLRAQGLVAGRDFELIPEGFGESRPVDREEGETNEVFESRCRRIELAFQRIRPRSAVP